MTRLENFVSSFLVITLLILIFSVDYVSNGKFVVVQLYSIPIMLSALLFGIFGVSLATLTTLILKLGTYLTRQPVMNMPEMIGMAMLGVVVMMSRSLALIKLDLYKSSVLTKSKTTDLNEHVKRLRIINKAGSRFVDISDIKDISRIAVEAVCELYDINEAIFCMYNKSGDIELVAERGSAFREDELENFYSEVKDQLKKFEPFESVFTDNNSVHRNYFACEIDDFEEKIGIIAGFSDEKLSLNEDEINALDILAEEIGIAARNCKLRQALENRAEMLESLVEVSKTLSGTFRMKKIYSKLTMILLKSFNANSCSVVVKDEIFKLNVVTSSSVDGKNVEIEIGEASPVFRSIKGKRLAVQKDKEHFGVAIPMIFEGAVLGALHIEFPKDRKKIESDEKALGRAIADQAALLINRAKVYENLKKTAREATSLAEAGSLLISKTTLEDRLSVLTEKLTDILKVSKGAVFLLKNENINPAVAIGLNAKELMVFKKAIGPHYKIFPGIAQILSKKKPVILMGIQVKGNREIIDFLNIKSMLVVPLIFKLKVIGLSFFWEPGIYKKFDKDQVELTQKLTEYSSVAIHTAELYDEITHLKEESEERSQNLRTLLDVSQIISSPLRTKTVLRRSIEQVRQLFAAEAAVLLLYDNMSTNLMPQIAVGIDESEINSLATKSSEELISDVFSSRTPMIINDFEDMDNDYEVLKIRQDLRSASIVPLIARGRSIGALILYSKSKYAFNEKSLELLSIFSSQAALAINTASLYEEERKVAETLQRSLLPDLLPKIPGVDVSVLYVPAHLEADVGGDYYDFVILGENKFGIVVGDVCGKGIAAAADTAMARYYLQAFASRYRDPATVLHYINQVASSQTKEPQLVTMIYAVIDMEKMELKYANAGHPPPFIIKTSENRIFQLETTGPIVGATPEINYSTKKITIHPDDVIFFYTDGLTEAKKVSLLYGEERLRNMLLKNSEIEDMDLLIQKIYSSVLSWAGGLLQDDMAMVGLKLKCAGYK